LVTPQNDKPGSERGEREYTTYYYPVNLPDIFNNNKRKTKNQTKKQRGEREYKISLLPVYSPRQINSVTKPVTNSFSERGEPPHISSVLL